LIDALLGCCLTMVDVGWIAGIGVDQNELADVMHEARHGETVPVCVASNGSDPVGGVLGGESVQPKTLRCAIPAVGSPEEVERADVVGDGPDGLGAKQLDRGGDGLDTAAGWLFAVGEA
jgi:hypothetical protein